MSGPSTLRHRLRTAAGGMCWGALGVLVVLQVFQPDAAAAVALVPVWCWVISLALVSVLVFDTRRKRVAILAGLLVTWCVLGEEPLPLTRGLLPSARSKANLRVVSWNCAGSDKALQELGRDVDVLLLQEVPGQESLDESAKRLFGEQGAVVYSRDCAILAAGPLEPVHVDPQGRWVIGRWQNRVLLASLRLRPPAPNIEFWTPGFWVDHQRVRQQHRDEIRELMATLNREAGSDPVLIGGDFNAPGNDAAWNVLRQTMMTDAFAATGTGWPHTGTNDIPLFRVDLIWTSTHVKPLRCVAQSTTHSDHRRVRAEFVILRPPPISP